jgi:hypothetical protein
MASTIDAYKTLQVDPEAEDEDPARRAAYDASRATATRPASAEPIRSAPPPPAARPSTASGPTSAGQDQSRPSAGGANRPPETVSRDWTSGRSGAGGGYDASTMRKAEGHGAGGPPPGNPSGTVLEFGRYMGWSIGEIARTDSNTSSGSTGCRSGGPTGT